MIDHFRDPRRRLSRAKEHVRDLERKIKRFFKRKPYARVGEPDPDGIHVQDKIKITRPLWSTFSSAARSGFGCVANTGRKQAGARGSSRCGGRPDRVFRTNAERNWIVFEVDVATSAKRCSAITASQIGTHPRSAF